MKNILTIMAYTVLLCSCAVYDTPEYPVKYENRPDLRTNQPSHSKYSQHQTRQKAYSYPQAPRSPSSLYVKMSQPLDQLSPLMYASYLKSTGLEMVKNNGYSPDNGQTWQAISPTPRFDDNLPAGYRRRAFPIFIDYSNDRILRIVPAMDTPGLNTHSSEPSIAMQAYYLRYRVSLDGGHTYLFDNDIIQKWHTKAKPFDGVYSGQNGIFVGDVGSQMIKTQKGEIIVPAQAYSLGGDGKVASQDRTGFINTVMIIGHWVDNYQLEWEIGTSITTDSGRSTRGLFEPTVIELPDGRILAVMRGSNGGPQDPLFEIPSYRWYCVSSDGGYHWSTPEPWTYDDGVSFYSPSSMSQLIRHSSGRYFWLGNINSENSRGDLPRSPLVIGEVNPNTLALMKGTIVTVDTNRIEGEDIMLSHWWAYEDRETHDIVIAGNRYDAVNKSDAPWLWRVSVGSAQ